MKEIITKESLEQSVDLISDIELNDEDYKGIYDKFSNFLSTKEFNDILKKISDVSNNNNSSEDIGELMRTLLDNLKIEDINLILKRIIKNEELIDYIQDLFLEKLI